MKKLFTVYLTLTISTSAMAFNKVTEILPSGKILICKDAEQVRNGDSVENHTRNDTKSTSDFSKSKSSEFKLPAVGQKIKLTHRDFHSKGKKSSHHVEELGTAIIVEAKLEGEERLTHSLDKSRHARHVEKTVKLTKAEVEQLQKDCLVAMPENGLKLNEKAAVSWE